MINALWGRFPRSGDPFDPPEGGLGAGEPPPLPLDGRSLPGPPSKDWTFRHRRASMALQGRSGRPEGGMGMQEDSTPTLQELIESGRLPVGTKVRFNRREGTTTATVVGN